MSAITKKRRGQSGGALFNLQKYFKESAEALLKPQKYFKT